MRSRRTRALVVGLGLIVAAAAAVSGETRRPITEKDLRQFRWIADPQISPDGSRVAFVLVSVDEKEDHYDTSLWVAPASGSAEARRLTAGPRDPSPRWSPDSRTLAFTRSAGEKDRLQIWLLSMSGGD